MYIGGEVFVECLSDCSVFVHSPSLSRSVVYKVKSGYYLKVFSLMSFADHLKEAIPKGFSEVYRMISMCTIGISFVKGWGADYQRKSITCTPCWVQVHLSGALKWLDKVLTQMNPPPEGIHSNS